MRNRALAVAALSALLLAACGGDSPSDPGGGTSADATAPAEVTDLRTYSYSASSLVVLWTAVGDDGHEGTVAQYDVRYSSSPITESSWASCLAATSVEDPEPAGSGQTAVIESPPEPDVYVALKAADEVPNWSGLSNVLHLRPDPGAIQIHQLTDRGDNENPCVYDGVVSWVMFEEADEIYVSNLANAYPTLTKLTGNGGEKAHPSSHGSVLIAWQGRVDGEEDWEIFTYHHTSIPRYDAFTDNEVDDKYPVLAGGGDFAWLQGDTPYEEVRYWDEASHNESSLSHDCCPTTEWTNEPPTADDGIVVWRSYDRVGTRGFRTLMWDGWLDDISDDVNATMTRQYSLHAGALAYHFGASPPWITYWDGGEPVPIAKGYTPSLYDGKIAYEWFDGNDWEIRYWDGTQVVEITDNDFPDLEPSLHGGYLVWSGRPPGMSDQIFYARLDER